MARSKDKLKKTFKLAEQAGGEKKIFCIDLKNIKEIKKFAQNIKESEDKTDILVNVAGIWHSKDKTFSGIEFADYSTDEILDTYAVGLTAPII